MTLQEQVGSPVNRSGIRRAPGDGSAAAVPYPGAARTCSGRSWGDGVQSIAAPFPVRGTGFEGW